MSSGELATDVPSAWRAMLKSATGTSGKVKADLPNRVFKLRVGKNRAIPGMKEPTFCSNTITTSKYTLFSFIPRSLFEQFRRLANVYFLVIVVLLLLGTYTPLFQAPLTPWTTLLPLVFVLTVTMFKEGLEDFRRHLADRQTNTRIAEVLSETRQGEFDQVAWQNIKVGSILRLHDKQEIPADVILLYSSDGGNCYIETSNIDGETNLKLKEAARTAPNGTEPLDLSAVQNFYEKDWTVECEGPNNRIHHFTGVIRFNDESRAVPIEVSNFLLRGSSLRNTKWVLGLVVYTGKDTKIVKNSRAAPSKLSRVEKTVNNLLYLILFAQIVMACASLAAYVGWGHQNGDGLDYICILHGHETGFYKDNCTKSKLITNVGMFLTFYTLYNNFVPISLYVTIEMVNYFQAGFIGADLKMYDKESDMPALARTSNMNGDLASVQYVLSDKTGTLTRNVMKFKRCSVGGKVYGNMDEPRQEQEAQTGHVTGLPLTELSSLSKTPDSPPFDFILPLVLCHTVVLEKGDNGKDIYQAESPDEEALVSAAEELGFKFTGRSPGQIHVTIHGVEQTWELLDTIAFNSTRKRMSVVVKSPEGEILLLTKGADNIMFERTGSFQESDKSLMDNHLEVFAQDGLRTLVLAKKKLSVREFSVWHEEYQAACASVTNRTENIMEVAEKLEKDLVVVGATAIEDKLQEGVPDTIADLLDSGIKVWVLTGDKMETAINIGYSCRLLNSTMTLLKLKDCGDAEVIRTELTKLYECFEYMIQKKESKDKQGLGAMIYERMTQVPKLLNSLADQLVPGSNGSNEGGGVNPAVQNYKRVRTLTDVQANMIPAMGKCFEPQADSPPFRDLKTENLALVVDGPGLVHLFGDAVREQQFLRLAGMCRSLVACRVSPAQKRLIVRLVKKGIHPKPVTLAIGDGANDVAMIQEAQIGVGISGKEGRQAVNSADFAIAQFQYLRRLLLIHGRWDYRRISKVILYSFYKNIVLTMILFYFSFSTGFSGQSLFQDYVYSGYNFFLAMPIICIGFFDRDMCEESVMKRKWVYMSGRDKMDLNMRNMTKWFIQALIDSILLYFLCWASYKRPSGVWGGDEVDDLYIFGTTVYSCMLMAMMYKACIYTYTFTWVNFFFLIGSIILYLIFLFSYSALSLSSAFYWVPYHMFTRGIFWFLILLVPTVSLIIDYVTLYLKLTFNPDPVEIAIEKDRIERQGKIVDKDLSSTMGLELCCMCVGASAATDHLYRSPQSTQTQL